MVRFICVCAFVLVASVIAIPVYYGVSKHKTTLIVSSLNDESTEDSLSFDEIYKIASDTAMPNPAALNDLAPAAGSGIEDSFSSGFSGHTHPALTDEIKTNEEESTDL